MLVGARAVLIRGPAGSGKSRLALALLHAAKQGLMPFARLVADDRAHVEAAHGRLLVRPAPALAGLIEVRGLGIRRLPLRARWPWSAWWSTSASRMPNGCPEPAQEQPKSRESPCRGLQSQPGRDALPMVLAYLQSTGGPG